MSYGERYHPDLMMQVRFQPESSPNPQNHTRRFSNVHRTVVEKPAAVGQKLFRRMSSKTNPDDHSYSSERRQSLPTDYTYNYNDGYGAEMNASGGNQTPMGKLFRKISSSKNQESDSRDSYPEHGENTANIGNVAYSSGYDHMSETCNEKSTPVGNLLRKMSFKRSESLSENDPYSMYPEFRDTSGSSNLSNLTQRRESIEGGEEKSSSVGKLMRKISSPRRNSSRIEDDVISAFPDPFGDSSVTSNGLAGQNHESTKPMTKLLRKVSSSRKVDSQGQELYRSNTQDYDANSVSSNMQRSFNKSAAPVGRLLKKMSSKRGDIEDTPHEQDKFDYLHKHDNMMSVVAMQRDIVSEIQSGFQKPSPPPILRFLSAPTNPPEQTPYGNSMSPKALDNFPFKAPSMNSPGVSPEQQNRKSLSARLTPKTRLMKRNSTGSVPLSPTVAAASGGKKIAGVLFGGKKGVETSTRDEADVKNNIGLKLALPSTLGIMTGKEPPPPPAERGARRRTEQPNTETRDDRSTSDGTSGFNANAGGYFLRSSETEPSKHQVSIPSAESLLMHARICALMESYSVLLQSKGGSDGTFDFSVLAGKSRDGLEMMHRATLSGNYCGDPVDFNVMAMSHVGVNQPNPAILTALLETGEDIVVEAYFFGVGGSAGTEATIFGSQRHRQFIVCYRGTPDQQQKPVDDKKTKAREVSGGLDLLHPDHPVSVHQTFRDGYFCHDLERRVFGFLNELASRDPFFDVIMTGHSFGAALATIASVRYAALFPMIQVSCHAYGAPRVGGMEFRHLANSLPNLKIIRVENAVDTLVSLPDGDKWVHAGHSIVLSEDDLKAPTTGKCSVNDTLASYSAHLLGFRAQAFRFDRRPPKKSSPQLISTKILGRKTRQECNIHESYVNALQSFTHMGQQWVTSFHGEDGAGISGLNDEKRWVV